MDWRFRHSDMLATMNSLMECTITFPQNFDYKFSSDFTRAKTIWKNTKSFLFSNYLKTQDIQWRVRVQRYIVHLPFEKILRITPVMLSQTARLFSIFMLFLFVCLFWASHSKLRLRQRSRKWWKGREAIVSHLFMLTNFVRNYAAWNAPNFRVLSLQLEKL